MFETYHRATMWCGGMVGPPGVSLPNTTQAHQTALLSFLQDLARTVRQILMSTHASVLVDSVGPPSTEVCRAAASFP
jgi:hypothetical protein